jgi:membrane protein
VLVWLVASFGFGYYVSNFANYQATYGSLGAVIVLLLFFYLSAIALLLGAELNAVIIRGVPAPGDPRPRP